MYNEIKNANIIARDLLVNPSLSLDDFLTNKKLAFEAPIKDYSISSFNKLKEDVRSSLKTSKDEGYIKILKRSLVEISQLERTFLIVQNLNKHNIVDEQRPLFFWQNKDRIVVGNVKKIQLGDCSF